MTRVNTKGAAWTGWRLLEAMLASSQSTASTAEEYSSNVDTRDASVSVVWSNSKPSPLGGASSKAAMSLVQPFVATSSWIVSIAQAKRLTVGFCSFEDSPMPVSWR